MVGDLRWFGRRDGRTLLQEALGLLGQDPTRESRNMKTLQPNRVAQRELRLFGKYTVLFNVDEEQQIVTSGERPGSRSSAATTAGDVCATCSFAAPAVRNRGALRSVTSGSDAGGTGFGCRSKGEPGTQGGLGPVGERGW